MIRRLFGRFLCWLDEGHRYDSAHPRIAYGLIFLDCLRCGHTAVWE